LYCLLSEIRVIKSGRMGWAGNAAWMGMKRNRYRALMVKPQGWRPLVRPTCKWEDNIVMCLG
jgi:hypothetical protein